MTDIIDDLKDPLLLHQAEQYIDSVLGRAIITIEKLRRKVDDLDYSVTEGHLIVESQKEKIERLELALQKIADADKPFVTDAQEIACNALVQK
jgi:hypothetical protein